ncbi:MAG TPA: hypothetical protein VFR05_08430 [Terriglobia bacterium]|nr:hypothetical protein [Terriglobia bacterium]
MSFPTKNFYWDGIQFAQEIETGFGGPWFFHPNHLLYSPLGRQLWLAANAMGWDVRALTVLQIISMVTGAAAVAMMFLVLLETGASPYFSACFAMVFAFCATWWRFATDAGSYVPSIFLILVCFWLLVRRDHPPNPFAAGLTLCGAMLLHQLAALFVPIAVLTLWLRSKDMPQAQRLGRFLVFVLAAGVPTAGLYAMVFVIERDVWTLPQFMAWVTSHSQDVSFSFDIPRSLWLSLQGHIRLMLGGNLRLVLQQRSPVSIVAAVGLAMSLLVLLWRLVQMPPGGPRPVRQEMKWMLPVLGVWWGIYVLFLVFWLPHNTFYRLFYLPALIILISAVVPSGKTKYNRLALAVAALFLLNFGFHIYPQTKAESNPPLQIAGEMRAIWSPGDVVYWDVFNANNRTIRYFNPQVEWKELWDRAYPSQIELSLRENGGVWFDSRALAEFRQNDPELESWLRSRIRIGELYEFPVGDHVVGFAKLEELKD